MFHALPPLSLYVHLPWCVRKCPYCDFNSHEIKATVPETDYLDSMLTDLEQDLPSIWGRICHTVFIGGGTPSVFSPDSIASLLSEVRARVALAPNAEITLEANPGSSDAASFKGYRDAGVNRLSIGVQSFENRHLQRIGRVHDGRAARSAIEAARDAGFPEINLDLMFGLPGQTADEAEKDIETAMEYAPEHISAYQLTIEPNTLFHHQTPADLPDEDRAWDMQTRVVGALHGSDYRRYEVSAFARDGARCKHNMNYWRFGDYLGIGAGAHSKITFPDRIERRVKAMHPKQYIERSVRAEPLYDSMIEIAQDDVAFEFMLNALRLTDPVPVSLFQERTGQTLAAVKPLIDSAIADGLMYFDRGAFGTTDTGYRFLDELLQRFLPKDAKRARPVLSTDTANHRINA